MGLEVASDILAEMRGVVAAYDEGIAAYKEHYTDVHCNPFKLCPYAEKSTYSEHDAWLGGWAKAHEASIKGEQIEPHPSQAILDKMGDLQTLLDKYRR